MASEQRLISGAGWATQWRPETTTLFMRKVTTEALLYLYEQLQMAETPSAPLHELTYFLHENIGISPAPYSDEVWTNFSKESRVIATVAVKGRKEEEEEGVVVDTGERRSTKRQEGRSSSRSSARSTIRGKLDTNSPTPSFSSGKIAVQMELFKEKLRISTLFKETNRHVFTHILDSKSHDGQTLKAFFTNISNMFTVTAANAIQQSERELFADRLIRALTKNAFSIAACYGADVKVATLLSAVAPAYDDLLGRAQRAFSKSLFTSFLNGTVSSKWENHHVTRRALTAARKLFDTAEKQESLRAWIASPKEEGRVPLSMVPLMRLLFLHSDMVHYQHANAFRTSTLVMARVLV